MEAVGQGHRSSPLPPGERVRVRGMHGVAIPEILAVRAPHPDPLPGGERGITANYEWPRKTAGERRDAEG
ncbi:hypothetical protein CRT60_06430 [Azospirillum palustre]|uniref:Uncharacterized protein n=1 Tax=Azospirillum palustre TaxID=2044885 RepID=A0A2B8BFU1_9PROT|nr:hypothetical protein CRT60_06430 [Azospirillum palustre]